MSRITPFLWYDNNAEEAVDFYISIFKNSRIISKSSPNDKVLVVTFTLDGQELMALNGGPYQTFNEAVSMYVNCETQEEVDYYWDKLSADPKAEQCGWLKDKYGLSWQIVPSKLTKMLNDPDSVKSNRVLQAMLKMKKIDINILQQEYSK